ncbi:DUF6318 family protein [Kocuria kalidii]|uniref:DUF6318 family protein n=1 Tax=Kocuria kalidii TaxID=3376283 RepID=UPI003793270C
MVRSYPVGTAVGGVALAALLLTGCGTDDDGAAASPSAAAPTAAPASLEPGPDATSEDYVPASLDGPAQNVPKPVMPELAKEESRDGAQAFLDYWSDAMWYAYQTGDTSYARDIISLQCEVCLDQLDLLDEIYDSNAWAIGGRESVRIQDSTIAPAADGVYKPVVLGSTEGAKLVEGGRISLDVPPDDGVGDPHVIYMDYMMDKWIYISAADLPGAGNASK